MRAQDSDEIAMTENHQTKVLIIEDQPDSAATLAEDLMVGGYIVLGIAHSVDLASFMVEEHRPDLIIVALQSRPQAERDRMAEEVRGRFDLPVRLSRGSSDSPVPATVGVDRRQSSSLIKERQRYFWLSHALNSAADGIAIVDSAGRVHYMNPFAQHLTGWSQPEAYCEHYTSVLLLEHAGERMTDDLVRLATLSEEPLSLGRELVMISRDGRRRHVEAEVSAADVNSGAFGSAVFTIRDVTQRTWEDQQHKHKHAIRAVERLAETTSHTLNNLLTRLLGNGDLLLHSPTVSAEQKDAIAEIYKAAEKIAEVVQQLSIISRSKFVSRKELKVNEIVEAFLSLISRTIPPNIAIHTELDPALRGINADQGQLEQVLFTLVANAREAMPYGGDLFISTQNVLKDASERFRMGTSYVTVRIRDTGEGMSQEVVDCVFEPFFTTKKEQGHVGLGLSITQGIVRDYNGFLEVETKPGVGTEVTFGIPAMEADPFAYLDESAAAPASPALKTILVVEDDHAVRLLVRKILERREYRVIEARDGEDALLVANLNDGRVDVVVTDVSMPRMSGPDLVQQFAPLHPETKFLLISGFSPDKIDSASLPRGVAFLKKPFRQEDLVGHIQSLLANGEPRP